MPDDSRCNCKRCKEKKSAYQRQYYWGHPEYREEVKERLRKTRLRPNTRKNIPIG